MAVIEEAELDSLADDIGRIKDAPAAGQYDAVLCLGNAFNYLHNDDDDDDCLLVHRRALVNLVQLVKPGGLLIIDHCNFDTILETGSFERMNKVSIVASIISRHCNN